MVGCFFSHLLDSLFHLIENITFCEQSFTNLLIYVYGSSNSDPSIMDSWKSGRFVS